MRADDELGPLPSGRHGLTREQVAQHQRERLLAALTEVVVERGYVNVTIGDITKVAAVSRRAFYQHFQSKEECFLAVFDALVDHLRALVEAAVAAVDDWPHQVVAALRTLLSFFDEESVLAHVFFVDSLTAGPAVSARFQESVRTFVPLLRAGRSERSGAPPLPESTEETIVGALAATISRSVLANADEPLADLLPDFAEFLLLPYLGPLEARAIARESSP